MESLLIEPFSKPFDLTFTPPGSKSLTNRALVLAALSDGPCVLSNALFADDTRVMIDGLQKLGFDVTPDETARTIRVVGRNGEVPVTSAELFCGNSGTTIRFLTALCALGHGEFTLDGIPRMRQRPIGPLVTMLKNLGVRFSFGGEEGYPPITVKAAGFAGGLVKFGSETSSQFLSALLHIAPFARNEVIIDLVGKQTSWPYVAMTMRLMDVFHHLCELTRDQQTGEPIQIAVPVGTYHRDEYLVEPDASNASYFLALAALHNGSKVTIEGLGKRSLQGDVGFADLLHQMGAQLVFGGDFITVTGTGELNGIEADLSTMPDVAQTLAVVALFAEGETVMKGLHTLRVKETDRVAALQNELTKLGAEIDVDGDTMTITPPQNFKTVAIDTYDDHRMAMSFALAGTKTAGVRINDPKCVNKTYPNYFEDLERFRA